MIFEKNEKGYCAAEDWKLIQTQFPYMGAFLYLHENEEAYFDDNCFKILRLTKEHENGLVERDRFTQLMQDLTRNPATGQNQVYLYSTNGEQIHLRLSFVERDEKSWMGMIQDITHFMAECTVAVDTTEYDPLTHLFSRDAFLRRVQQAMSESTDVGYLAVLHVHGIDQLTLQFGYSQIDRCMIAISQALRQFQSPQVIVGVKGAKEFFVYLSDDAAQQAGTIFTKIRAAVYQCVVTDDFGEVLDVDARTAFSMSVGYCAHQPGSSELNTLMNHASFALFKAMNERREICAFNEEHYRKHKEQYKELQYFRRLIRENLFQYHVQPIVSARTGEIVGFEALMRAGDIPLSPLQILKIAEENKSLYQIERLTFYNVVKLMSENLDLLENKKVFINAIPSSLLTEPDFDLLYETYGEVMEHIVVEITEQGDIDSDAIDTIKARCATVGCEFAIDDYGAGYSNTSSLLALMPEYVKIDRCLLSGIDSDTKKQRLVADVIRFCNENAIQVIAEGIETRPELRTIIRLGADLIQGYYTSRPKSFFSRGIAKTVQNEIISINLESKHSGAKSYTVKREEELALVSVALDQYTDVLIKRDNVTLIGETDRVLNLRLEIESGMDCTLTLRDVNLKILDKPLLTLGDHCNLTLVLEGENTFSGLGILVPETATLTVVGEGDLKIIADSAKAYAIGNDYEHAYGNIVLATSSKVELSVNGDQCIGIGGGLNPQDAEIRILSGEVDVTVSGIEAVCVGCYDGNARVDISDCELSVNADAANAVGVGSFHSDVAVYISSRVDLRGSGNKCVGIGALEHGRGSIDIRDSDISTVINARFISCIGTIDGEINTIVDTAHIALSCEGSELAGIGDPRGSGQILLKDAELDMTLMAAKILDVGTKTGSVSTQGGRKNVRINT